MSSTYMIKYYPVPVIRSDSSAVFLNWELRLLDLISLLTEIVVACLSTILIFLWIITSLALSHSYLIKSESMTNFYANPSPNSNEFHNILISRISAPRLLSPSRLTNFVHIPHLSCFYMFLDKCEFFIWQHCEMADNINFFFSYDKLT